MKIKVLLLSMCLLGVNPLFALEIYDDFSNGAGGWSPGPGWSVFQTSPGVYVYRADVANTETYSKQTHILLDASWRLEVDLQFQTFYNDGGKRGLSAIALFPIDSGVQFLADVDQLSDGSVRIDAAWFDTTNMVWHTVQNTGWMPGSATSYHLQLTRFLGSDRVSFAVTATNGFAYRGNSPPIPLPLLDKMRVPGFRANWTKADFSRLAISTPFSPSDPTLTIEVKTVRVNMFLAQGAKYQLESSSDLLTWMTNGSPFIAPSPLMFQDIDVTSGQRYFHIYKLP